MASEARRGGFSLLETVLAVAIIGLTITFMLAMYTRLAAYSQRQKYSSTAKMVGYVVLEQLEDAFLGLNSSEESLNFSSEVFSKLKENDNVNYALKISVSPQELATYKIGSEEITTCSGEGEAVGGKDCLGNDSNSNRTTYFLALRLRKLATLSAGGNTVGFMVEGIATVYWTWGMIGEPFSSVDDASTLVGLTYDTLKNAYDDSITSDIFDPSQSNTNTYFIKGQAPGKIYVQVRRVFYVPVPQGVSP